MAVKGGRWRLGMVWLALLGALGLFASVQIPLNETHAAAWAGFQKRFEIDNHAAIYLRHRLFWLAYRESPSLRKSIPLGEVEQALNGGMSLERDRDNNRVWWTCPHCGGKAALRAITWEPGVIDSTGVEPRTDFTRDRPGASAAFEAVLLVRRTTYAGGYALWGVLFVVFVCSFREMVRQRRLRWCNLLLAVASGAVGLSLLGPQYWRAASQFIDDDAAGIGWIQLGISLALLLAMWRYQKPGDPTPHCRECGYNLTGNTSGQCPECGTVIVGRIKRGSAPLCDR